MPQNSVDFEVCFPPSDSISALEFSPAPRNMLCAGSWDQTVRTWHVEMNGATTPNGFCKVNSPVLDVSWSDDSNKVYLSTAGREVQQWDLQSNQLIQIGTHDAGVRSCHWIKALNYACLMTGSWDKTLKVRHLIPWFRWNPAVVVTPVWHSSGTYAAQCRCSRLVCPIAVTTPMSYIQWPLWPVLITS